MARVKAGRATRVSASMPAEGYLDEKSKPCPSRLYSARTEEVEEEMEEMEALEEEVVVVVLGERRVKVGRYIAEAILFGL